MTTLSEIDKEKNFIKAGILENQWWGERRLPVVCNRREVMLYIERLEAKLDSIEKACKRDALFKKFLDQGFWHAHEVDLIWRYSGEDRRHEADWLKSIFYALKHEREEATRDHAR